MTENDEIRLKIAKLKGWTADEYNNALEFDAPEGHNKYLPNWPESIKDCYALEDEIPEDQQDDYISKLEDVILRDGAFVVSGFDMVHATPTQRCKAWIAWKESQ
jgi:hypothetical protein